MPAASEPIEGSVMQIAPNLPLAICGNQRCFCCSFPNLSSCSTPPNIVTEYAPVKAEHTRASSSATMQVPVTPVSVPPYFSGIGAPNQPLLATPLMRSAGNSLVHAISSPLGRFSSANFFASSASFFCLSFHHG